LPIFCFFEKLAGKLRVIKYFPESMNATPISMELLEKKPLLLERTEKLRKGKEL
jgi:hypothetical protein